MMGLVVDTDAGELDIAQVELGNYNSIEEHIDFVAGIGELEENIAAVGAEGDNIAGEMAVAENLEEEMAVR